MLVEEKRAATERELERLSQEAEVLRARVQASEAEAAKAAEQLLDHAAKREEEKQALTVAMGKEAQEAEAAAEAAAECTDIVRGYTAAAAAAVEAVARTILGRGAAAEALLFARAGPRWRHISDMLRHNVVAGSTFQPASQCRGEIHGHTMCTSEQSDWSVPCEV